MVTIRKATQGDESAIFRIADEARLRNISPEKSKTGFIIYSKSPEKFLKRIRICRNFFVAIDRGEIVGYLLANNLHELRKLKEDISYLDELKKFSKAKDVAYLDQLVVTKEHTGKGVGQNLLDYLYSQISNTLVIGFIVHSPVRNQRSIDFFVNKNHWHLIREVKIENMVCGLYGYRVRNSQPPAVADKIPPVCYIVE